MSRRRKGNSLAKNNNICFENRKYREETVVFDWKLFYSSRPFEIQKVILNVNLRNTPMFSKETSIILGSVKRRGTL